MASGSQHRAPTERAAEAERPRVSRARALFQRAFSGGDAGDAGEFKDSGVGRLLCATRMRLGKDLQHVGQVLHIRYTYLVAIEDGRYEDLPGQAYAIGFVRAYADHLGLDGNEVVRRFKEESTGLRRKAALDFPIPTPDSGIPSGISLLGAVVLGIAVYGGWYAMSRPARTFPLVQEVPTQLAAPTEADAAPAPDQQAAAVEAPEDLASEAPPPPTNATDAPAASASDPQIASAPTDAAPVSTDVLELRAKVDDWIQVRKGEQLLLTKLLKKGDVYRVPEPKGLTLMTGNAGGLEVLINGEVMAPLGDPGAVASAVPLEVGHFKSAE